MEPAWSVFHAMPHCAYKAWQLNQNPAQQSDDPFLPGNLTAADRLALTAYAISKKQNDGNGILQVMVDDGVKTKDVKLKISAKATKLLNLTLSIVENPKPPEFYKNKHCPDCQFRNACYEKLVEKDCISLLGSISPKVIERYHKKGIFTVLQMSHLFRPRRRSRRKPKIASQYLWELKALAIREKQTYVMYTPDIENIDEAIFIDFESLPDEQFVYLIGGIIRRENMPDEAFSFWADKKEDEKEIFRNLTKKLNQYPDFRIYHYGSFESRQLKAVALKYGPALRQDVTRLQRRMINALSYLRTHVYPPTYGNGLKEVGNFLQFRWTDDADGVKSIQWRKHWENTGAEDWKDKLIRYNYEDCNALLTFLDWLHKLSVDAATENVCEVAKMKKLSPFKFQANLDYGADYDVISKAAYFDYQQKKIYWRGKKPPEKPAAKLNAGAGKGIISWMPKKANEIVTAKPLQCCPGCGSKQVYNLKTTMRSYLQTDIKFTSAGIRRHVVEYRSTQGKCGKCFMKYNNAILKRLRFGDNLFAYISHLYIKYNVSSAMIAKLIDDQFSIPMRPMYVTMRKYKWWKQWEPEADYLWKILLKSPVIHIDETTVRLTKDTGYVWVFATPHTVFYHFTLTREADFLKQWLKKYDGVIITDFFPGYEMLDLRRQKCLIHLIRDLNDDLHKNPFDISYKLLLDAFNKLLVGIIATVDKFGLRKVHLQKHLKDTDAFYQKYLTREYTGELSVKYVKRLKKHWDELWLFLSHDDIPWNNNNAEAAVKAFAQHRRSVNGVVTEPRLREYLKMLSLAQTCRYRNIPFLDFLRRRAGLWENVPADYVPAFLPFLQARQYVRRLGFTRKHEWVAWLKSGKRPPFIPASPQTTYRNKGWIDLHDWLGFKFLSFEKARAYMRRLGLKNRDEYWAWLRSDKRPQTIPYSPEREYRHTGWKDLGDWLGTGNTGQQRKKRMSYEQAKTYIQSIGIKTQKEFFAWRKTELRPETMPPDPNKVYFEFEGWGAFLGTNRIANHRMECRSYDDAKAFVRILQIKSVAQFRLIYATGAIPSDIPKNPYAYYSRRNQWISFPDFFGKS